ncbi:MAG: hypothetical protein K8L99_07595 [Anaerolineae bacterium]|nr:hypothetical protein [Anaerolineae bacterium]
MMKYKKRWLLLILLVMVMLLGMQTDLTLEALRNSFTLPHLVSNYSGQAGRQWLQKLNGGY